MHIPVFPELQRQKQEDLKFEALPDDTTFFISRLA